MKIKRINWKKRYLNLLKRFKKLDEENHSNNSRINNHNWEVETGRKSGQYV